MSLPTLGILWSRKVPLVVKCQINVFKTVKPSIFQGKEMSKGNYQQVNKRPIDLVFSEASPHHQMLPTAIQFPVNSALSQLLLALLSQLHTLNIFLKLWKVLFKGSFKMSPFNSPFPASLPASCIESLCYCWPTTFILYVWKVRPREGL